MTDLAKYPERVGRKVAMQLLDIRDKRVFKRVVDATADLAHKLPGEKRAKYRKSVIARLLLAGVRPEGKVESLKSQVSSPETKTESRTR